MVKNDFIENFRDHLRKTEDTPLAKAVVSKDGAFNSKLSATVSPCCWMNPGSPFQITVQMVDGGKIIVQERALTYDHASVHDMQRLLGQVQVQECICDNCTRPAFSNAEISSNREGRCETCFMENLNLTIVKQIADESRKKRQTSVRSDKRHKIGGYTHRVNAWVHTNGDDLELVMYMAEPTDTLIRAEIQRQGYIPTEFTITVL